MGDECATMMKAAEAMLPERRMTALYWAFHYLVIPLALKLWTRLCVQGREHLPRQGALIVISNHVDNWDTYVVGLFVRDRVINYLARADGMDARWLGWYWRQFRAIPADREGLGLALRILRQGGAIGVFPEGTIAPALVPAIPGSALLALRSGATVVPAAVWGTERIRPWSVVAPPRVTLRYGPPRVLTRARGQDSQAVADALMREIAAMLPPRYRGAYAVAGGSAAPAHAKAPRRAGS
jgi:1-acyl-sn-glycerol-3-phosphate acyltransferase